MDLNNYINKIKQRCGSLRVCDLNKTETKNDSWK